MAITPKHLGRRFALLQRRRSIRLITLLALAASMVFASFGCSDGGSTVPVTSSLPRGYADMLLSPVPGSKVPPSLNRNFPSFPVTVAFVPSPHYTVEAQQDAQTAFNKWTSATSGAVKFNYAANATPTGAQIVVQFVTRQDIGGTQGFTIPQNGYIRIQVAVDNPSAPPAYLQTQAQFMRVCTHEMGHALGINGHSPNPGDTMSLSANATEVSQDDVATLRVAYGGSF